MLRPEITLEVLNERGRGFLPHLIGVEVLSIADEGLVGRLAVRSELLAPNGFLHAAAVVALADTLAGYGTIANLPPGATGFATVELKSNFIGTAREGAIVCSATPVHRGRTLQVWDAVVSHEGTQRRIALFRCTQMILSERD